MKTDPAGSPRRPSQDAADRRVAVRTAVGTLLVVLLLAAGVYVGGRMRRQADTIEQQSRMIQELAQRSASPAISDEDADAGSRATTVASQPATQPTPASQPAATQSTSNSTDSTAEVDRMPTSAPSRWSDEGALTVTLDELIAGGGPLPYDVTDRQRAAELIEQTRGSAEQARWSGATLARLALLARLLGQEGPGEWFAVQASAAGTFPLAYHEIVVRQLLDAGRSAQAAVAARRAVENGGGATAAILLALAEAARGDLAAADELMARLEDADIAGAWPRDRLQLGDVAVALERWGRLETVVASLTGSPVLEAREGKRLRAILALRRGKPVEALALLDELNERFAGDYAVQTWRGVALLEVGQFAAARDALVHAEQSPSRPEAWYWRGVVELRDGQNETALPCFERAIAASNRFAAAWEGLGVLALAAADQLAQRGDEEAALAQLDAAVRGFATAVQVQPRRASAHFLLAVTYAKASRGADCATALQAAMLIDRAWLDVARRTPVILRLFAPEELDELATP